MLTDGYTLFSSIEHDSGRLATVRMTRAVDGIDVGRDLANALDELEAQFRP